MPKSTQPKSTRASAHVSPRNSVSPPLPVTPQKPKGRTANVVQPPHSSSPSVGLPITPVSQLRGNGKRLRKSEEVTIISSE
ncbi:hypothetical protein M422DRAFT_256332 [Sphaerobolus stellatus SS14]|uniref:Uncharacterized protein n=1 Tax=Sphaerobolus stellatus (strain SS14) TaxID=990650 RepID=A0A0C9V0L2_SPHS4|nr:hypothetical protein M422DRAFT_256332 [Sphaerobolus stellatus SS14]